MTVHQTEKDVWKISRMDRKQLVQILRRLHCRFELDFTDEFLEGLSLERLRHIVVAALLHADQEKSGDDR